MALPATFPDAPWRLKPTAVMGAWLVRGAGPFTTPSGWRPLKLGPWRLIGAVWARYGAGGTLAYDEVAVGLVVRRGLRLGVSIGWIRVDDAAALEGGRDIWAVPKEAARFEVSGSSAFQATTEAAGVEAKARGPRLPFRLDFWLAQPWADCAVVAPARVKGRLALAKARWRMPFGFGRPIVSAILRDGVLVLGAPISGPPSSGPGGTTC